MQPIHLLVLHEGAHWISCEYMARVAETVASQFKGSVTVEKVITKDLAGAKRYREICEQLGRPAPVPSLFTRGNILFDRIPGEEELKSSLEDMLGEDNWKK